MRTTLRIKTDPATNDKSLDDLTLERQFKDNQVYSINTADLYVFKGSDIVASGSLNSGSLVYNDPDNSSLKYVWSNSEVVDLTKSAFANCKARWNLNNSDRILNRWFNISSFALDNPITELDLLNEKPELDDVRPQKELRVTTDSTDKDVLECANLDEPEDFWVGSVVEWKGQTDYNNRFIVTAWDKSDSEITLENELTNTPSKNDRFVLYRSFYPEINAAFDEICHTLNSMRPNFTSQTGINKVVDSMDLRNWHLYLTISKIASNLRTREGDVFDLWSKEYNIKAVKASSDMQVKLDLDEDGTFEETETSLGRTKWLAF